MWCASAGCRTRCTALIKAAVEGHLEVVRELLKAEADLNVQADNGYGDTGERGFGVAGAGCRGASLVARKPEVVNPNPAVRNSSP